jgi:hypothetical protein
VGMIGNLKFKFNTRGKFLVSIDECYTAIITAMLADQDKIDALDLGLWEWMSNKHGVKRAWDWDNMKNYLVFDSEGDYVLFLLKL